jgi:voltage-gated potassium channel
VTFLVVYSIDVLAGRLPASTHHALEVIDYVIWAAFAVEYVSRISLARDHFGYWWRHLPDLGIIALPILRPLRLLRLVMLLRVLNRPVVDSVHGRVAVYGVSGAALLVYCAALAELDAERHAAGANITTFADAIWWAVVTVCTVGYGDRYPVTGEGRLIGAGLMVGGIALLAAITASFATWLIDRLHVEEVELEEANRQDLRDLQDQLDRMEQVLADLKVSVSASPGHVLGRADSASS